jgi:hypothetical protein
MIEYLIGFVVQNYWKQSSLTDKYVFYRIFLLFIGNYFFFIII